ncbi:hypothetical protein [Sphingobacterium mizutaii]|uniref:hypothetical protein n=1 Tax=Sphingobacterium mizutaii TaxID=1010 RepID=UPI001629DB01|nr:hypothetical protein [Sphingobacterium mizutaii]
MAHDELMKNEEVIKLAEKYNAPIPQLAIRQWFEPDLMPLAKTANPKNIRSISEIDFSHIRRRYGGLKKM